MVDLTPEYCDQQYNFMSREAIGEMLGALDRRSAGIRATLRCELDVRYGPGGMETLDLFHAAGECRGLLIFIHGGYWIFADKGQFSYPADSFTRAGVAFAAVNYTLAPEATIERQIDQCRRAAAFLYQNARALGCDPEHLYVSGHSAGGHLASMVMLTDWPRWQAGLPARLIKGGLTISGLHDLEAIRQAQFLNAILQLDAARVEALSPVQHEPVDGVALYVAVGGRENQEYQRQARMLGERWRTVLAQSVTMPDEDHFSILDRFGDGRSPLFEATLEMMGLARGGH